MSHASHAFNASLLQLFVPGTGTAWFRRMSRRLACMLAARRRRLNGYRDLQLLDERALRDIGLSHRAAADSPRGGRGLR
jgi:uncharacterized protein YjiS (DUF1127 family)